MLARANRGGLATSGDGIGWILEVETRWIFHLVARRRWRTVDRFTQRRMLRSNSLYYFFFWVVSGLSQGFRLSVCKSWCLHKNANKKWSSRRKKMVVCCDTGWFAVSLNKLLLKFFPREDHCAGGISCTAIMGLDGMEVIAIIVVIGLFVVVLKQFGIWEPLSLEGRTCTTS